MFEMEEVSARVENPCHNEGSKGGDQMAVDLIFGGF